MFVPSCNNRCGNYTRKILYTHTHTHTYIQNHMNTKVDPTAELIDEYINNKLCQRYRQNSGDTHSDASLNIVKVTGVLMFPSVIAYYSSSLLPTSFPPSFPNHQTLTCTPSPSLSLLSSHSYNINITPTSLQNPNFTLTLYPQCLMILTPYHTS